MSDEILQKFGMKKSFVKDVPELSIVCPLDFPHFGQFGGDHVVIS